MALESIPEQPPIPGYEPVRLIGVNLGAVYLARHSSSGALVALKVFPRKSAAPLRDLIAPLARLNHPNIVRVYEMGELEGTFFCALEYGERTLADRLLEGRMSDAEAARIARAVALALHYARDQGMIIPNLTPKAVLLTDRNVPKLMDFGAIETLGEWSARVLPSAFMAPEGPTRITAAADVYRVGALMYAMLTGKPPFEVDGGMEATWRQVVAQTPEPPRRVNPNVGRDLEAVCMKCLAKRPEARYVSLQELADHLKPGTMDSRPGRRTMVTKGLAWQIPLTVLACIAGSMAAVWIVSQAMGSTMNASVVAVLSAVLSVAAIAVELRSKRKA